MFHTSHQVKCHLCLKIYLLVWFSLVAHLKGLRTNQTISPTPSPPPPPKKRKKRKENNKSLLT